MPNNFIQKAFGLWLSRNRARFRFQPRIVKKIRNCIALRFAGISQKIGCVITSSGLTIYVNHEGECWDIVADFGVSESRSSKGYYCGLCEPEKRKFFASREELWIEHCFEPMLEWTGRELNESRWVYLFATDGATWAEIREKDDCTLENKNFVNAFPVLERMKK